VAILAWVNTITREVTKKPPKFPREAFLFLTNRFYETVESHVSAIIFWPFGLR
jgi:hypothetical protein